MNYCETCKFWGAKDDDGPADAPHKTCGCDKIGDYPGGDDTDHLDTMDSVWHEMGCPTTGPKFGCVHHESK